MAPGAGNLCPWGRRGLPQQKRPPQAKPAEGENLPRYHLSLLLSQP